MNGDVVVKQDGQVGTNTSRVSDAMVDRSRYEELMLEHQYGLLGPDEELELNEYLATTAGATLKIQAQAWTAQLQGAARESFPDVHFSPPAKLVTPNRPTNADRLMIRQVWTRWAVAACLMIVLGGMGVPAAYQFIGWSAQSYETANLRADANAKRDAVRKLEAEQHAIREQIRKEHEQAQVAHRESEKAFHDALANAKKAIEAKEFTVRLRGPDRIQPGAPNEWQIDTLTKTGAYASPKKIEVVVRDQKDTELLRETHADSRGSTSLKLAADFWKNVKPGSDLFLEVVAYADDDRKSVLAERVPLARPVYVTHLVTDKPLYKPGEVIRFRSLTLDRSTFLPPSHDMNLQFFIRNPDKARFQIDEGNGRVLNGLLPVVGPDGKPVRGIGTGEYQLGLNAPGGEYTLEIVEIHDNPRRETILDVRRFLVNTYVPDTFEKRLEYDGKSYGASDTVQARVEVSRTAGGPMKDARADIIARLSSGKVLFTAKGARFEIITDQATRQTKAVHSLRFKLPDDLFANRPANAPPLIATLAVTIQDGSDSESIVRPIPFVEKDLRIEFFPEGGDLVEGLPSRVFFQVRMPSGKPADLKGTITDGTNKLLDIATMTDSEQPGVNRGQGLFTLTPEAGKKYFLKLASPVGMNEPTKEGFPLPIAKVDGMVLKTLDAVTEKGQAIRVQVLVGKGPKILHIGAYARGRLISHQRIEMEAGKPTEVKLQGDESLGGVTRITVFEEPKTEAGKKITLIPLAERLVYRKPGEQLILSANPDKARYGPAGKVALEISALNEKQNPTPAILLVGVVNQSIIAMADNKTDRLLPTHFLLAGDVKNPADLEHADILLTDHPKAAVALDLLLGMQGWRRFAEQNILPTNPVEKREVERMLVAHGQRTTAPLDLFKLEEKRVAAEFMPKVEQAGIRSASAQNAWVKFQQEDEPNYRSALASAKAHAESLETQHTAAAAELYNFETRIDRIRGVALPIFLIGLLVLAFGGIAFAVVRRGRERKPFVRTAAASFAMAVFVIVAVFFTRATPDSERAYAKVESERLMAGNRYSQPDRPNLAPPGGAMNQEMFPARAVEAPMPAPRGPKDIGFKPPVRAKMGPEVRGEELQRMREAARMVADNPIRERADPAIAGPQAVPPENSPLMSFVVREYAHERDPSFGNVRADFTETVYWHPVLVLPDSGKTTVNFQLSDDIARYQILVAGHTTDGRIGAMTKTIEARKPFTVDPKLPLEVSHTDTIDVPIRVVNDSDDRRAISFTVTPYNLAVEGGALKTPEGLWKDTIDLTPNGKGRKIFRLKPTILEGDATLTVLGNSDPAAEPDAVGRLIHVVPEGFPFVGSFSDMLETRATGSVVLPKDMVKGTLKIRLEVYPTSMADLVKGLDGLLREPSGCFEQTSTTNYPNTLILDYLNQSNQVNPLAAARAKELLDKGYSMLTAFECPDTPAKLKQGFEWFGSPDRAHEALTAYGLLQFKDMARVHNVDPDLIRRTQAFLISRRDGAGGFKRNAQALDSFGGAPKHTTDAYIVWALVESDPDGKEKLDLKKEIEALKAEAMNERSRGGKDAYFVALTANVLLQRGDRETAMKLLDRLKEKHFKAGAVTGGESSITRSGGRDLDIETTALTMLGWLRSNETKYAGTLKECTTWLSQQRGGHGGFGSTQSTILALKALILHAKKNAHPTEAGEIKLLVGGKVVGTKRFSETEIEVIGFNVDKAEEIFSAGAKTDVEIVADAKHPYPFSLSYTYTTLTPVSAEKCAVKLETKLGRNEATEGETVPLTVSLKNLQKQGQGMAVAIVGLPAGMKVPTDMKQLTELREKGTISFFEMRGRELILYWRELAPEQKIDLNLELVCEVPGHYRGPASRGYLYYNADHKHWVEPMAMRIQPMGPAGEKVAKR